jgi:hypothetical protein
MPSSAGDQSAGDQGAIRGTKSFEDIVVAPSSEDTGESLSPLPAARDRAETMPVLTGAASTDNNLPKSPTKVPTKSPPRSPMKSPMKSPTKSPTKSSFQGPPTVQALNEHVKSYQLPVRDKSAVPSSPGSLISRSSNDHPGTSTAFSVDSEDDDEDVRAATEMAMAFAQHPHMSPDQIQNMVLDKRQEKKKSSSMLKKSVKGIKKAVHPIKKAVMGTSSSSSSNKKEKRVPSEGPVPPLVTIKDGSYAPTPMTTTSTSTTTRKTATSHHAPDSTHMDASSVGGDDLDLQQEQVRINGIVWKRRSGLGKYSVSSAWERRRIVLKGNRLYYYKTMRDTTDEATATAASTEDAAGHNSGDDTSDDGHGKDKKSTWLEQATAKATSLGISTNMMPSGYTNNSHTYIEAVKVPKGSARGYLDLVKEYASVGASFGHSGAPTPFALSIKVLTQTKWKLCFDTYAEMMQWLAALTDVVVQGSVDSYNTQILQANDPTADNSMQFGGQLSEPPVIASCGSKEGVGGHRLWIMGVYKIESAVLHQELLDDLMEVDDSTNDVDDDDENQDQEGGIETREAMALEVEEMNVWSIPDKYIIPVGAILNLSLMVSRTTSTTIETFWFLITFMNVGLIVFLSKHQEKNRTNTSNTSITNPHILTSRKASIRELKRRASMGTVKTPSAPLTSTLLRATSEKAGGFIPHAGTTSMRIANPTDLPVNKDGCVFAGWRCADPGIMIRSHGYASSKKKVPSPGELYHCTQLDIFESKSRCPDMASRVKLPKVDFGDADQPKTWNAPDIFVISIALPTDPPKLYGSDSDGGGYTITMYFTMKQETRDILRRVTADGYRPASEKYEDIQKSQVNAVRLLDEWCRRAPTDDKFMSRFKVVPNAQNLKEIGMPGWIGKYNGKPFLIKRPGQTGFLYRHPELSAMEFDISLHPFPYLAKQGICFMKDSYFKKVLVTFGFTIEGRSDDELPECLIGQTQLCYPDPIHAIQGEDFFSGRSAKSYEP